MAESLRAADPQVQILNAGLDPYTPHTGSSPFVDGQYYLDEESFIDQMAAANPAVFDSIDLWASHSYPTGPLTDGPWQQSFQIDWLNDATNPNHVEPPAGVFNRGVNGYEWELFKLESLGVRPLPVMITETGWRHAESSDPQATDNGRPLPPAKTVADYVALAFFGNQGGDNEYPSSGWIPWQEDPRVVAVTPFALNGWPAEWGHSNWLALDAQGRVLETYVPLDWRARADTRP